MLVGTNHYIFTYTWQCNNKYHGKPGETNENHQRILELHDAMGRSDPGFTHGPGPTDDT
jgi:hypothetical protein